jgi:glycerophosphoryl diester phosphodiesterase
MSKEVSTAASNEALAALRDAFPVDPSAARIILPRLTLVSQDKVKETGTGKAKKIEVLTAAGTYLTEVETDEEDADGKKVWKKTEIGESFDGVILYQRKQLRMYDAKTEQFTSSPIYDTDDETVPLFASKAEVARGTPAELKSKYMTTDEQTGKPKSKLEDNVVLYVKKSDDQKVYQLTFRGSSMYSFKQYSRKVLVPSVETTFSSEARAKGTTNWNMATFAVKRRLDANEIAAVTDEVNSIRSMVAAEKSQYGSFKQTDYVVDADVAALADSTKRQGF